MPRLLRRIPLVALAGLLVVAVGFSGALASNAKKPGDPGASPGKSGSAPGKSGSAPGKSDATPASSGKSDAAQAKKKHGIDGDGGAVRIRRRNSRRHLHLDERQRHGGQDPHLRRNHPVGEGPGPPAPVRERHARLRQPDGLRRAKPVLRVHHGPLREPDRTRSVHARRRPLPAADQQPAELAARRDGRLRQARLGDHGDRERRRRRPQDDVHEPGRRPGVPRARSRARSSISSRTTTRSGWTTGPRRTRRRSST